MKFWLGLYSCSLLTSNVKAWSDEGHMIIAAIAENLLESPPCGAAWTENEGKKIVENLNRILSAWDNDYPKHGNMIGAATWMDYIKCNEIECESHDTGKYDALRMFNHYHYVDISLDAPKKEIRKYFNIKDNSLWLLHNIFTALKVGDLRYNTTTLPSPDPHRGTIVSLNLMLRMIIHIIGDIHQPLHMAEYIDHNCYPNGDGGGNSIHLLYNSSLTNLHNFWDSSAMTMTKSLAKMTIQYARDMANEIIDQYAPINPEISLSEMAWDTHNTAVEYAYEEIRGNSTCFTKDDPYIPSQEYINTTQSQCRKKILDGGYHLAYYLFRTFQQLQFD